MYKRQERGQRQRGYFGLELAGPPEETGREGYGAEMCIRDRPTDEEIRTLLMSWYNSQTDAAILSGFAYNGAPVWRCV